MSYTSVFLTNTLMFLTMAAIATWYVLGRLRLYAKARLLSYVFPVNFLAFGGILSIIAIFRLTYSASLFTIGMLGALVISYVFVAGNRRSRSVQYVVPGGRVDEMAMDSSFLPAPSLVEMESLVEARRLNGAIIADLHHDHPDEWERLFAKAALNGIPVYHFRQIVELQSGQVIITHLSENSLGSLIPNVPYMATKRVVDVVAALLALPFCLVAFAIIGLVIKLDSRGGVFFIQDRMGFRGQTFRMVKFRTMRDRGPIEDEEERRKDAMTQDGDARVTRVGRLLRKTRLDELPQIFNVLNGEMSWIGPRPEAAELSAWYESELPFYSYRHIVRPGMTGWAQVNQGHVTDLDDVNAKLRYDFYYVKNISLWLDMLIALKTIRIVFGGFGAK
ncbi:sugar transferase [Parerythrobacter aestuarii]|uniref:sugar transferase n=1 Tax=Parerythrobacter aestuarii TaxID=3020909 RepID=UPI0024DE887C|nr:sugar transferase [Parerythrobacter aestuarii]